MTKSQSNSINTNQANRLSVQISLTGLSFLMASENGEVTYFRYVSFESHHTPEEILFRLTQELKQSDLARQFDEVNLIYTTHNYSVIPSTLFDKDKASEYLKFNTKILSNDFISFDEIEDQDTVVVYVPLMNINNYIFDTYGSFNYYHSSTLLLRHLLQQEKHSKNARVYIHFQKGQFDCFIFDGGKLLLCNSYLINTPEDFVYYLLFCLEQLKMDPDAVETLVFGEISSQDSYFEILYTYVRNVGVWELEFGDVPNLSSHQQIPLKLIV